MMVALLLSDDLIDTSRVTAQARAEGRSVLHMRSFQQLLIRLAEANCVMVDLHHPELDLPQLMLQISTLAHPVKVIGFGSHVDHTRLKAARQAGLAAVMPRSQFFEEVQTELSRWLQV